MKKISLILSFIILTIMAGCMTSKSLSTTVESLPEIQASPIVKLSSGDIYTMEISEVKVQLGKKRVKMLSYNGSIPGPTIQAPQGAHITLRLINKAPSLVTTLHSHGIRLDNLFDGVPKSMMGSQDPLLYGDSFDYQIVFPDAGVFRYHPHVDEQIQQELGLYGNFLVIPDNDSQWTSGFDSQQALILDDIQLTSDSSPQVQHNSDNQMMMGRYGNVMLVNGQENYSLTASSGDVARFYFTNTANVRPFNLMMSGAKMKLIGSDIGMYEKPTMVDHILISPAERYIVDVYFSTAGSYSIVNDTPQSQTTLMTVQVDDNRIKDTSNLTQFLDISSNKKAVSDIDRFRQFFNKPIDKSMTLDMTMTIGHGGMNMNHGGGMIGNMMGSSSETGKPITMPGLVYDSNMIEREDTMQMMNDMSNKENTKWKIVDDQTKKENMDIQRSFKKGDVVKVLITNKKDSAHPMQHPIHFHGQRFLILTHNGIKNTNLVWKDTVLLGAGDTVELLIDMSNPGIWMAHCHIAEHLMDGMMMSYTVK